MNFFNNLPSSSSGGSAGTQGTEFNILLLGETGAGKSTTINAFANYLKYEDFEDAIHEDFVELISSKFALPDPNTGEALIITSGSDDNEAGVDDQLGKSSTLDPRSYKFNY